MNSATKTLVFAAVAAVSVGAALLVRARTSDPVAAGEAEVGGYLYADPDDTTQPAFADPSVARGMQLATFDDETAELDTFKIHYADNAWRLDNFNDYPADAGTRLAETLTAVSYVRREGRQSRRAADHAELGVLDPLNSDTHGEQGHGDRITITGENDAVLVDMIVGKRVPDSGDPNLHYVRRADEDEVYRAVVKLDVSTRFRDWVDDDLLALDPTRDISALESDEVDDPDEEDETPEEKEAREERERLRTLRTARSEIVALKSFGQIIDGAEGGREILELTQGDGGREDWSLAGLDAATEELDNGPIRGLVNTLERLRIIGVRRKPEALNADLSFNLADDPRIAQVQFVELLNDLRSRGFSVLEDEETGERSFISSHGSLIANANNGVVYNMFHGREFRGSEKQLQIGSAKDDEADAEEEKVGRYLVVHVTFDENFVSDRPEPPTEPVRPAELDAPAKKDPAPNDNAPKDEEKSDEATDPADDATSDHAPEDEKPEADEADGDPADPKPDETVPTDEGDADPEKADEPPAPTREQLQQRYDLEMAAYRRRLKTYEEDLEKWKERVEIGRQRAEVLQKRFGDWYYVISADDYEEFAIKREHLVKKKEVEPEPPTDDPSTPDTPGDDAPKPSDTEPPGDTEDPQPTDSDTPKPDTTEPPNPSSEDTESSAAAPAEPAESESDEESGE